MRIAIAGATGLVGSSLLQELFGSGFTVQRLQRPGSKDGLLPTGAVANIAWQPSIGTVDPTALEYVDALIYLAGRSIAQKRWTHNEKRQIRDSRVLATEKLVEQIVKLERKPRVFLCASAVGYYGDCGNRTVAEEDAPGNDFLGQLCRDWENASRPLAAIGIRVVHARLGVVLSPTAGALSKMLPLFRWGLGGKLGSGTQFLSWIALDDCVQALLFLLNRTDAKGAFNVVSPSPITNLEFTRVLATAVHRPALLPTPKLLLRLALGEMADALLLSSCRAEPNRLRQLGFEFKYPELKSYLRSLKLR